MTGVQTCALPILLMGTSSGARTFSELQVGIDESPTISATNISVTLV